MSNRYEDKTDQILYYKFRNKLYLSVHKKKTQFVHIYQLNPDKVTGTLVRKYMRTISNEEFVKYIHKNGLMLWSARSMVADTYYENSSYDYWQEFINKNET